jgi:glc operon protein GlcG
MMRHLAFLGALFLINAQVAFAAPPVTYFDAQKVTAAFTKGAVLFDGGTNYMVHASRRDAPGQCEIHTKDTDIIYVVEGSTTFVTGGECIDPKPTAPNEIRGAAVRGGDSRRLSKGDVIIVPNNTPHWFKKVKGPVLYYVVKVR